METARKTVLTATQAACFDAVRAGNSTKTKIAINAKLSLKATTAVLKKLDELQLMKQHRRFGWRMSKLGQLASVEVVPDPERKVGRKPLGSPPPGSSAKRLLKLLDTPKNGRGLAKSLGLSHQGVHQIVVNLLALGCVRIGDDGGVLRIVARADDPTVLLSRDEARVLSTMPEGHDTSIAKIRGTTRIPIARAATAIAKLQANGFVGKIGRSKDDELFRLSETGLTHPQRDRLARRASPPRPKVQSDRVFSVLSHIAKAGEVRIRDVRDALGIPQKSMNALMQYLKRIGLVQKTGAGLNDPYKLTDDGCSTLNQLEMRLGSPSA